MKKFLSLVLALIMVMSLVTVSAGADYADDADINYDEAVAVVSALGIVGGSGNSFFPNSTLSRGAAAKIICNIVLGVDVANGLAKDVVVFPDVPANSTFSGYVAYCAEKGIIGGYPDGTFRPSNPVTGTAFLKMLLGALGYDAAAEGYTGGSTAVNVAYTAAQRGLTTGIDTFLGSKNLTREEACQLVFNTLKSTTVKYSGSNQVIQIGDLTITNKGDAAYTTSAGDVAQSDFLVRSFFSKLKVGASPTAIAVADYSSNVDAKGMLKVTNDAEDSYGRPAHTWTYDTKTVGTYAAAADYSAVVTADTQAAATIDSAKLNKVLGITATNAKLTLPSITAEKNSANTALDALTLEPGDKVEVYVTAGTLNVAELIVIRESYGKILKVTENTAKAKATKTDDNGDAMVYNYKLTIDTNGDGVANITTNDLDLAGYTSEYVEGAYLSLIVNGSTVLASSVAETITGAATTMDTSTSGSYYITVAGAKVTFANNSITAKKADKSTTLTAANVDYKTGNYTVVLNDAGYAIAVLENAGAAATLDNLVYTNGTEWVETETKYGTTKSTVYVQVVGVDGVAQDVVIGGFTGTTGSGNATANSGWGAVSATNGTTVSTDLVANAGLYVMTDVAATSTVPAHKSLSSTMPTGYGAGVLTLADTEEIKTSDTRLMAESLYITSGTQFMQVTGSGASTKTALYTGSMGYKNASGGDQLVYYVVDTVAPNADALMNVVAVVDAIASTSADVLYISAATATTNANGYEQANVYDRAGNKLQAITVASGSKDTTGFVTYKIDADGVYTLSPVSANDNDTEAYWASTTGAKYFYGAKDVVVSKSFYADRVDLTETAALHDIPGAETAVVVDLRTASAKESGYNATLSSVADIFAANETLADETYYYVVEADVYLSADGVATIFVKTVQSSNA